MQHLNSLTRTPSSTRLVDGFNNVRIQLRELPLLARHYASGSEWPLNLRNALSGNRLVWPLATEAWLFAD